MMLMTVRRAGCVLMLMSLVSLAGCAVVEPEDRDIAQVRAAVGEDPGLPIEQLSRELGISPAAVIAALPESKRRRLPNHEAAGLLAEMGDWGTVTLDYEVIGHLFEYLGPMPRVTRETTRHIELTPEGEQGLRISLAKRDIASVWLLRYPAEDGAAVWFCEEQGEPWLVIRIEKTGPGFNRAWDRLD